MPQRTIKRKHHFRPVLHLKHFSDSTGLVWCYDREQRGQAFQTAPKHIGYQKLLYAPHPRPSVEADSVEDWFEKAIDRPTPAAIRALVQTGTLTPTLRSVLARFIVAQDMRTPTARDTLMALMQRGLDEQQAIWRRDPAALREDIADSSGTTIPLDKLRQHLDDYEMGVTVDAWLAFIQERHESAAKRLFALNWSVMHAPEGGAFISNDLGIVKCVPPSLTPVPWRLGSTEGRTAWIFPVTSQLGLLMAPTAKAVRGTINKDWLIRINEQCANDAVRFVFSSKRLEPIAGSWIGAGG
ncbi:MAG: DUF4238 domain-containing protein [Gemmatimonadaceae bacterium]